MYDDTYDTYILTKKKTATLLITLYDRYILYMYEYEYIGPSRKERNLNLVIVGITTVV